MWTSADTHGGWKNHYKRMRRWEERSLDALKELPFSGFQNAVDYALVYFVWSHSLREWLLNDNIFSKVALDDQLRQHRIWKLCRDVANRTRHLDLKQNPTDKDWSVSREHVPFSKEFHGHELHTANIFFDGQKLSLIEAITKTAKMWETILNSKGML